MLGAADGDCGVDDTEVEKTDEDVHVVDTVAKLGSAPPTLTTPACVVLAIAAADNDDELADGLSVKVRMDFGPRSRTDSSTHVGRTRQALVSTVPMSVTVTVMTCPQGSVPMTLPGYPHLFLQVEGQLLLP